MIPQDQDDRWFAYVHDNVLHLHRSWTGHEVYRVSFGERPGGERRIDRLLVEGNQDRHRMKSADEEAQFVERLIDAIISGALVTTGPTFELVLPAWKPHEESARRRAVFVPARCPSENWRSCAVSDDWERREDKTTQALEIGASREYRVDARRWPPARRVSSPRAGRGGTER